MSSLQVFNFDEATAIRTDVIEDEVYFVAKDLAEALDYASPDKAYQFCKNINNAKSAELNKNNNLAPATKWIPESDMYRLIMRSTKPEAERFQDWVVAEVLPTIRKTGSYTSPGLATQQEQALKLSTASVEAAKAFGFTGNQAYLSADKAIKSITGVSVLALMGAELVSDQEWYLIATQIGERLEPKISARKVNTLLVEKGLQYKNEEGNWSPTEPGKKYGVFIDTEKKHSNGTPIQQLKWKETIMEVLQ